MQTKSGRGFLPLLVTAIALPLIVRAADAPNRAPASPETVAGGYRIVLEKVHQSRSLALPLAEGEPRRVSGTQQLYLEMAVHPPGPGLAGGIHGLEPRVLAFSEDNRPVPFASHTADDANPLADNVWRTRLLAGDVELSVSRLERLQGEMVVYPRARPITLDFALPAQAPVVQEAEGVRATLKSAKQEGDRLSLVVETEWADGVRVSRLDPDLPEGAFALSREGAVLSPQSASMSTFRRGDRDGRQHSVVYSLQKAVPAKLRVQFMVRSGVPQKIPFTLPSFALPDTLNLPQPEGDPEIPGPLTPGHPLYAQNGGTLRVPVRPPAGDAPHLVLSLARREGESLGPVRWLEVPLGPDGALLTHLRPGRYRATRAWSRDRGMAGAGAVDVEVIAGKEASLPPLAPPAAAAPPPAAPPVPEGASPSVQAGPYRVAVERVNANGSVSLTYRRAAGQAPVEVRQAAQLHLAVYAPNEDARTGLTTFQVSDLTVHDGRRVVELPHYGGVLPNGGGTAAVRAYIHAPAIPPHARELHSLEGQIVAWDRSAPLELDIPLAGKLPVVLEKEGVRATVRELDVDPEDGVAQIVLWLEADSGSMILSAETDGGYGVSLLDARGKAAAVAGGAYLNPRPHQAEYRLEFTSIREAPATARVRLLHRRGPRRVYPFRIERVPLPARPEARPASDPAR